MILCKNIKLLDSIYPEKPVKFFEFMKEGGDKTAMKME